MTLENASSLCCIPSLVKLSSFVNETNYLIACVSVNALFSVAYALEKPVQKQIRMKIAEPPALVSEGFNEKNMLPSISAMLSFFKNITFCVLSLCTDM